MEEKNDKKRVAILLIVIIVVLLVLVILFATGIIKFKSENTINNTSNNNINLNDKVNIDLSIDNVEVEKDAINSSMAVTGTLNLSYDTNKYAGVALSGYCLGSENEKYLIHGPGDGHVLFGTGEQVLYLSEDIPQDVVYPNGTSKTWEEIDWNNVKIKYCKIDKMETVLNGSGNNPVTALNFEKKFDNTKETNNNEKVDVDKKILDEIKEKRFLAKNNIDIDSKVKYVSINSNGNIIYIVKVEHERDEKNIQYTYFFVTYSNGQVIFNKALENKYLYDLYYESSSMAIKAEILNRGYRKTIYGTIENGKFVQLDEFDEPISVESPKYLLNGNEISEKDFKNAEEKYKNKKYINFSEKSNVLE